MQYEALQQRVLGHPIGGTEPHNARVWRVAENVRAHAHREPSDDRLLHLMSRVGVLCEGLARELRRGHVTPDETAAILDYVAELGQMSFEEWFGSPSKEFSNGRGDTEAKS